MAPKEKAEELINKFAQIPEEGSLMWYLSFEIAKKCALIAVEEILWVTSTKESWFNVRGRYQERNILNPYWVEVKQEIEKL